MRHNTYPSTSNMLLMYSPHTDTQTTCNADQTSSISNSHEHRRVLVDMKLLAQLTTHNMQCAVCLGSAACLPQPPCIICSLSHSTWHAPCTDTAFKTNQT